MTKQQHLSWSPSPASVTITTENKNHHRHHHSHRHQFYVPLHRSITDENSYADKPSPITRFVTKLLGLGPSSSSNNNNNKQRHRPPLAHKSHSTTSITKDDSVISSPSSSQYNTIKNTCEQSNSPIEQQLTPISVSVVEWDDQQQDSNDDEEDIRSLSSSSSSYNNNTSANSSRRTSICSESCTGKRRKKKYSLTSSVSSSSLYCNCTSTGTTTTTKTTSAAVDALVSAATQIKQYEEEKRKRQQNIVAFLDIMDPPELVGRKQDTEPVLDRIISEKLRPYLPRRHRLSMKWSLLYSLDQHGASLTTLYRQCRSHRGPCVLAIKDANKNIFGAFLNEPFKTNNASYYGTGECFLWKYCANSGNIQVFPWTGKNEYMILSETEFIAIGGGDGKFGLWINSDLEHGHSEPCPTFDNECLSQKPEFACIELEIFAITSG
ncbi:TLD-domain-containing protein [Phascolomyces articulosus]|uniref:Oxidation resistance protein 1 n=1 Tax=Phascolomyces articulosus TaxID=60185 RepID=A0AAD5JXD7_9FUNG|nr:TLD-domain-containing protein [Phascolomyces articulosus]